MYVVLEASGSPISLSWCVEDFEYFTGHSFEQNPRTHVLSDRKDPPGTVKVMIRQFPRLKNTVRRTRVRAPKCPWDSPRPVCDLPQPFSIAHASDRPAEGLGPRTRAFCSPHGALSASVSEGMVSVHEEPGRAPLALVIASDCIPDAPIDSPYQTSECTSSTLSSISTTVIRCSARRQ